MPFKKQHGRGRHPKRGEQATQSKSKSSAGAHTDGPIESSLHNWDQPCSHALTDIARQILAAGQEDSGSSGAGGLPAVLWEHLLQQKRRRHEAAASTNTFTATASGHAKKKRKKKKKKKAGGESSSSTATATAALPLTTTDDKETTTTTSTSASISHTPPEASSQHHAREEKEDCAEAGDEPVLAPAVGSEPDCSRAGEGDQPHRTDVVAVVEGSINAAATPPKPDDSNTISPVVDPNLSSDIPNATSMARHHRLVHSLIDSFLPDPTTSVEKSAVVKSTDTAAASGTTATTTTKSTVLLASLHDFLGTLQQPLRLEAEQVHGAAYTIACSSCRRAVDEALRQSSLVLRGCELSESSSSGTSSTTPTIEASSRGHRSLEDDVAVEYELMEEGQSRQSRERKIRIEQDKQHWSLHRSGAGDWTLQRPVDASHHKQRVSGSNHNNGTTSTNGETSSVPEHSNVLEPEISCGWTCEELDVLLNEYVLLLGLPPDEITGAQALDPNILEEIGNSASEKTNHQLNDIARVMKDMQASLEKFKLTRNHADKAMDWQSFPIMKETDEVCDSVLDKILRVLTEVTTCVQRILSHEATNFNSCTSGYVPSLNHHWAVSQCTRFWNVYLNGIGTILSSLTTAETELFGMADPRSGNLPERFVNSGSRQCFHLHVQRKVYATFAIVGKVQSLFDEATSIGGWWTRNHLNADSSATKGYSDRTTSFARRMWTTDAFYIKASRKSTTNDTNSRQRPLDTAMQDVLTTIREITESVHGMKTSVLVENHLERHNKLEQLLRVVAYQTAATSKVVANESSTSALRSMQSHVDNLYDRLQALEVSSPLDSNGPKAASEGVRLKQIVDFRALVIPGVVELIPSWIAYRLQTNTNRQQEKNINAMPHSVQKAMIAAAFLDHERTSCHGGNGEHRAVCLLMGLFWQQLCQSFRERQAHVAAQELLNASDHMLSLSRSADTNAAKPNKKKKRKKKSVGSDGSESRAVKSDDVESSPSASESNRNATQPDTSRPTGEQSQEHLSQNVIVQDHPTETITKSVLDRSIKVQSACAEQVASRLQITSTHSEFVDDEHAQGEASDEIKSAYDDEALNDIYACVQVNVYDGSNLLKSAEEFFLERLTRLVADGEYYKIS